MNRWNKSLGNGIRIVTLLICVLTLCVGVSRAQVRPGGKGKIGGGVRPPIMPGGAGGGPGMPNQPPKNPFPPDINNGPPGRFDDDMIWECSQCKAFLSRGRQEPVHIPKCPQCGVRFNGGGMNQFNPPQNPGGDVNNDFNLAQDQGQFDDAPLDDEIAVGLLVGIGIAILAFVAAVVGIVFAIVMLTGGKSKSDKRRSRRRVRIPDY